MDEYNCFEDNTHNHLRTIIHIDLDCFYAQVEMLKDPSLHTKPLGIQQKNLLVTCNYVARELGLKKCMPLNEALKLCPNLVVVNGEDLYEYRKISHCVTTYLQQYSLLTERLGLDENFVDITLMVNERSNTNVDKVVGHVFNDSEDYCGCGCENRLKIGSVIAQEIRSGIKTELGLTSCAGIAHNKLLAKLAGALHKPNQQTTVFPKDAVDLVSHHDISKIPGIGVATIEILKCISIKTISDLQKCEYKTLASAFNSERATSLIDLSYGRDASHVKASGKPQSIGIEDSCKSVSIEKEVEEKFMQLLKRLLLLVYEDGRIPKTIKITIRKFDSVSATSHRETRQCNIISNFFTIDRTKNTIALKHTSEEKLLSIIMNLFRKLICHKKSFVITLLGLAFTKFQEQNVGKKSIATYFMKDIVVQSITNIENKSVCLKNTPTTSKCTFDSPEDSENKNEPIMKKLKCGSFLLDTKNGYVSDSGYSSPSKLKVADLRLSSIDSNAEIDCPPDVNGEVFSELPTDVQKELWNDWKQQRDKEENIPTKKAKTNTILNYFVKNY